MDNLPAKQSAFARIRNNILNAGLRNDFTRRVIANTAPSIFGTGLTRFVLSNDGEDFSGTMQLLASMNPRAVKANISRILDEIWTKLNGRNYVYNDPSLESFINMVLDAVDENAAEIVALDIIAKRDLLPGTITDETIEKITNSIDCSNKTTEEMDKILRDMHLLGSTGSPMALNLFGKLTPEQKKTYFTKFIPVVSTYFYSQGLSKMFEQFSPEDRLEEYKKILEVYKERQGNPNVYDLTNCFKMLTMEERLQVTEDTFKKIESLEDTSKVLALSNVVSAIPSEEKDKYHKNILGYCNEKIYEVKEYVSSLDRKQQEEVVFDVISKLREIKEKDEKRWWRAGDFADALKAFESDVISNALINVLNDRVDNPNFKFIANLLSETNIGELIISNTKDGQSINPNQLELASKQGIDVEGLTRVCVNLECDRLVQEFLNNPDEKVYPEIIQKIKELAQNIKINDNLKDKNHKTTSQAMNLKKESACRSIFYSLDDKSKGKYFKETIDVLISLQKGDVLKNSLANQIKEMYETLDTKEQIAQFPEVIGGLYKRYGMFVNGCEPIDGIWKGFDPDTMDAIYELSTNMINAGEDSEPYKIIRCALMSTEFKNGLIESVSKNDSLSFMTEELLEDMLEYKPGRDRYYSEMSDIIEIYTSTRLNKIINKYNALDNTAKSQNIDSVLMQLSQLDETLSKYANNTGYVRCAANLQMQAIKKLFLSIDKKEQEKHFKSVYNALNNLKDESARTQGYIAIYEGLENAQKNQRFSEMLGQLKDNPSAVLSLFTKLEKDQQEQRFSEVLEQLKDDPQNALNLFNKLDDKIKSKLFEEFIISSPDKNRIAVEILKGHSIKRLNEIFKGKLTIDEEKIIELISLDPQITMKTLLFDKDVDREKIIDIDSYDQLKNSSAIDINSIIQNLYSKCQGKSKEEFNQLLAETYNLFTYNNVPEFMKNFRIFQLGAYYDKKNERITSFQGKTIEERDSLILEDLFKISLDSNNESLRDFANIILEGKKITTKIQANPEEKIKSLSVEELALLNQYRDTLFDLHNLTKEIRKTDKPRVEKTADVLKDIRKLIAVYSDNKGNNTNSRNIVFNPNKIMDELFGGFITTSIRPKAMLEYMDRRKAESDERHLRIEQQLRDGTMHLEAGDFVKGIQYFDDYLPSMLCDGVKGGEFNQEHSHSDATPLDADFGYVSKANLKQENATDYQIISTTISSGYGDNYIVLKQYADRLQDRSRESFDQGTFTGSPDYYSKTNGEDQSNSDRYIRTGIPVTDIDYIVSRDWNPKNGYEMAMAGIYIPVINHKGEIVFSSDEYRRIRDEMRGLSHYGAENIQVSPDAQNMDALYAVYRGVSKKTPEEIEAEVDTVRGLVDGKPDSVTEQKKNATTKFIRDFFKKQGIRVADDLSQNLASQSVELIDTGSTGRGTNVPGDGDFDFMLRHNLPPEIITALADKVKTLQTSDSEFISVGDGFRTKNITLPTGEVVDIDVTAAKKSLALSYSSDMCVRDRLENIRENSPESYNYVKANIIMAKKILKSLGIYKKLGSDGATEHGGFGGIGVENWILQNGGSFKTAIDTFLEAADKAESYDEFKKIYPIFDFGFNHREGNIRHDRFSAFLANDSSKPNTGFVYVKETLKEIQKTLELEKGKGNMETPLIQSISPEGFEEAGNKRSVLRNKFSYSKVRSMIAKYMSRQAETDVQVDVSQGQSSLEVE